MTKSKKYESQKKPLKDRDSPKILKEYSTLLHLGKSETTLTHTHTHARTTIPSKTAKNISNIKDQLGVNRLR